MKRAGNLTGNDKFEGYIIDILDTIRSMPEYQEFAYEIRLVPDGQYGSINKNGRWNGMIGELIYGVCSKRGIMYACSKVFIQYNTDLYIHLYAGHFKQFRRSMGRTNMTCVLLSIRTN